MLKELETHSKKLLSLTAYTRDEYDEARNFVIQQIQVVAITNISLVNQKIAGEILIDIDKEDAPFLALAFEKNAMLWTGDKKLIKGLSAKEHFNIITTDILYSQYY